MYTQNIQFYKQYVLPIIPRCTQLTAIPYDVQRHFDVLDSRGPVTITKLTNSGLVQYQQGLTEKNGFFDMLDSSVELLVYTFAPSQFMMWFAVVASWTRKNKNTHQLGQLRAASSVR